jgi:hypothetical protein
VGTYVSNDSFHISLTRVPSLNFPLSFLLVPSLSYLSVSYVSFKSRRQSLPSYSVYKGRMYNSSRRKNFTPRNYYIDTRPNA